MMSERRREETVNFAPGPAQLPTEVIAESLKGAMNYKGTGIGVMELSHRSPEYAELNQDTMDTLRRLLDIPADYTILFLQGGGTGQFAAVPMNLSTSEDQVADYLVTGNWSSKAAKEAEKYVKVNYVLPKTSQYTSIPDQKEWKLSPDAAYVYYCWNETAYGIEFPFIPETGTVPLVCDASSNFLTRRIDFSKFGLVYAGAQKNMGAAGVTVVIVRKDLLGKCRPICPIILDYTVQGANKSNYNTPPVWSIYILNLMLKWIEKKGGVDAMYELSAAKSKIMSDVVCESEGFYRMPVEVPFRSRVNFAIRIARGGECSEELEKKFLKEAAEKGLVALKGYRTVGGLRASLYNACSEEATGKLATFMREFMKQNSS